jgi:hypothetical protein
VVALVVSCASRADRRMPSLSAKSAALDAHAAPGGAWDRPKADCSCLANGVSDIDPSLPPDDVENIRHLVALDHGGPIVYMRPAPVAQGESSRGDVEVETGSGCCGNLSGSGHTYILRRVRKRWRIVGESYWLSSTRRLKALHWRCTRQNRERPQLKTYDASNGRGDAGGLSGSSGERGAFRPFVSRAPVGCSRRGPTATAGRDRFARGLSCIPAHRKCPPR